MSEPKSLRNRQKDLRRDAILDAVRALATEIGYDAVSLDAVAERAELTKPTLYAYFENKEAMVLAAYLRVLELSFSTRADIPEGSTPRARLSVIVRRVLEANFSRADSPYAWPPQQVTSHPEFAAALDRIRDELADIVREGQESGEFAADLDPIVAVQTYFSIAGNPLMRNLIAWNIVTGDQLVDQLHAFILRSLLPPRA